jgi:hypothetical protein
MAAVLPVCRALQQTPPSSRRAFFATVPVIAAALAVPVAARALDMDAFMNKELTKVETPKMTDDEGLCRYGAATKTTGEACVRAGLSTKRAGGLDAFGNINRGDFVRCKTYYEDKGDKYEKKVVCE